MTARYNFGMHRFMLRLITVIVLGFYMFSGTSTSWAASRPQPQAASSPYDLVAAVNALRASHGLAPYTISPILMATAQAQADYMAATGNVSHSGPGGSSVTERLLAAGYPLAGDLSLGGFRSENITAGGESKTAQDAVNGWTGDAPHLNTMISPSLTEIGAGVSVNGGRVYYVIDCALPTPTGIPQAAAATLVVNIPTVGVGGSVIVPVVVATPNADGDVIHEVKAGQSLWQIAISYETKIDEIKRLNNLFSNDIYPGEKLLIRQGSAVSTSTPLATATLEAITTVTSVPTTGATIARPTATAEAVSAPLAVSTSRIMSVAIGIITLAILGGIFFVGMGDPKKTSSKAKQ